MNTTQIKLLTWLASGGLAAGLGWSIFRYQEDNKAWVDGLFDQEKIKAALTDVEEAQESNDSIVDYNDVKRGFQVFDWVGKPPPPEPEPTTVVQGPPPEVPETPVSDFVEVLFASVDTSFKEGSVAQLKYLPAANVSPEDHGGYHLVRAGDTLYDPIDHIKVEDITENGVIFSFTEPEDRENETLGLGSSSEPIIVQVGPGGEVIRQGPTVIRRRDDLFVWPQGETVERRPDQFRIGVGDADSLGTNYASILSRDVRHKRHRDPKTGKYDGIEITSVRAGSIAARHGAQDGDVIKSINGHPVTAVSEAVTFAKNNKDKYDKWEVVIVNKGKERTVTYETPPDN